MTQDCATGFLADETGAVTVDWVVLTAALVGLGLAVMTVLSGGLEDLSGDINGVLQDDSVIQTAFQRGPSLDDYLHPTPYQQINFDNNITELTRVSGGSPVYSDQDIIDYYDRFVGMAQTTIATNGANAALHSGGQIDAAAAAAVVAADRGITLNSGTATIRDLNQSYSTAFGT